MKTIIFDCDGTLVDSEVLSNEVLVEAVAEHGLVLSLDEAISAFRGGKMADCVAHLEARLGRQLPPHFVPDLRSRTADAFRTRLRPVAGAVELIQSLSALSHPICVASSGPMGKIELSLSLTGLLPFFKERIFSSYDVGVWKPDPGLFLHAAKAMGVAPRDCAVVEDSLPGIRAGVAAGMTVFAFQPHEVDPNIPAEVTVLKGLLALRCVIARVSNREHR
jgi:HAD superfamily hydrolase (TIGR01509 family)